MCLVLDSEDEATWYFNWVIELGDWAEGYNAAYVGKLKYSNELILHILNLQSTFKPLFVS
jgi:hypothetical protein